MSKPEILALLAEELIEFAHSVMKYRRTFVDENPTPVTEEQAYSNIKEELSDMLKFALRYGHPIAVRYPRGAVCTDFQDKRAKITVGKCEELISGDTVCILALGSMVEKAGKAVDLLAQKGFHPTLVNARFAKPIDSTYLCQAREKYKAFITIEDGVLSGGFGEQVLKVLYTMGYRGQVKNLGFPDEFIGQGDCGQLYEKYGLSAEAIAKAVEESYVKEAT